jgi:hypothetical protein
MRRSPPGLFAGSTRGRATRTICLKKHHIVLSSAHRNSWRCSHPWFVLRKPRQRWQRRGTRPAGHRTGELSAVRFRLLRRLDRSGSRRRRGGAARDRSVLCRSSRRPRRWCVFCRLPGGAQSSQPIPESANSRGMIRSPAKVAGMGALQPFGILDVRAPRLSRTTAGAGTTIAVVFTDSSVRDGDPTRRSSFVRNAEGRG